MDDPDADAIATAALSIPGVAALHGGAAREFAAYLPGRTVAGIRLPGDRVEVHLAARYGAVLPDLAERVRAAVTPLAVGLPVEVHIEDLRVDDEPVPTGTTDSGAIEAGLVGTGLVGPDASGATRG